MQLYGGYLADHFTTAADTTCWILLARTGPALSAAPELP
jgi:hypothetical protein